MIPWSSLILIHELDIVIHDQMRQYQLNLRCGKEPAWTGMLSITKEQTCLIRGHELMIVGCYTFLLRAQLDKPPGIKFFGVRIVGRITADSVGGDGDGGTRREMSAIGEGQGALHYAFADDCGLGLEGFLLSHEHITYQK